ncbi:MAG: SPFH domain-containing protein [Treponema sp.]|jgi:regulator of protease activity HflC (stomatin/prohibitin superfamily)|nr:SPFH domain-containing protein [Treponema sp.]
MMTETKTGTQIQYEEFTPRYTSGMLVLVMNSLAMIVTIGLFILGIIRLEGGGGALWVTLVVVSSLYYGVVGPVIFVGLKILKPNEALVLTLFGTYTGTLKGAGFFFVNPFSVAINPDARPSTLVTQADAGRGRANVTTQVQFSNKKISLKAMTLNNDLQKINDQLGNPIIIGIVVIWRVVNTAMAVFNVENFKEFLSIQCDSALRNIVRLYPYDASGNDDEKTLRSSSQEIAEKLKREIQEKTVIAGLEIIEARITHLAYAPEIAAAMLQRQQASAIIDARQMIVEGAVGMVEMALDKLGKREIVHLDEERKAAMVSNLLVVLCGNRDAQPVVNSGSLY